jgi:uncharacterized protein
VNAAQQRTVPNLNGRRPFLTANWRNLVLVNFVVPADLLEPRLPPGCVLDRVPHSPDTHLLSVVAMHFDNTRVWGVPVPFAQRFDEVNLRFYARQGDRHGSVFLRQYVPSRTILYGARWTYNQPYELARIQHVVAESGDHLEIRTRFERGRYTGAVSLRAERGAITPPVDSLEHFLKERYWGFDSDRRGRVFRYPVWHPVWRTHPVIDVDIDFDPGVLLGGDWRDVDWTAAYHSALFAEGSLSAIYPAERVAANQTSDESGVRAVRSATW